MQDSSTPKLSLGTVLKMGFALYKRAFMVNVTGMAVLFVAIFSLYVFLFPYIVGMPIESFSKMITANPESLQQIIGSSKFLVSSTVFFTLVNAIIAPMSAGFYKVFSTVKEEKQPSLQQVFAYYNSPYTAWILGVVLVIAVLKTVVFLLLNAIGLSSLDFSMSLIISLLFTLTIPYIIFENKGIFTAFGKSSSAVAPLLFLTFTALFLGILFSLSGILLCGFGLVFTAPFFYAVNYVLYLLLNAVKREK